MEFITILIALGVEQYYRNIQQYRQFDWFASYCDWMQEKAEPLIQILPSATGPMNIIVLLTPIIIVVGFVLSALAGMGQLFSFILSVVILIYSLGPRDIISQVEKYTDSLATDDTEGALLHANEFFAGHCYKPEFGGKPQEIAGLMKRGILLAFNTRILAVLFWFVLLGPVGALLYRLSILLKERFAGGYFGVESEEEGNSDFVLAVQRLYMILGWVPARLCVVTFALAGSFSDTLLCWRCTSDFFNESNDELIVRGGLHALKLDADEVAPESEDLTDTSSEINQILALIKWSLVIVVTVIALMTIVGWIY